jgi:hypothetical protein
MDQLEQLDTDQLIFVNQALNICLSTKNAQMYRLVYASLKDLGFLINLNYKHIDLKYIFQKIFFYVFGGPDVSEQIIDKNMSDIICECIELLFGFRKETDNKFIKFAINKLINMEYFKNVDYFTKLDEEYKFESKMYLDYISTEIVDLEPEFNQFYGYISEFIIDDISTELRQELKTKIIKFASINKLNVSTYRKKTLDLIKELYLDTNSMIAFINASVSQTRADFITAKDKLEYDINLINSIQSAENVAKLKLAENSYTNIKLLKYFENNPEDKICIEILEKFNNNIAFSISAIRDKVKEMEKNKLNLINTLHLVNCILSVKS